MAVETAIERAIMIADFGVSAEFKPLSGQSKTVTCIFDDDFESVETSGTIAFASSQPRITIPTANLLGVAEGDKITVDTVTYVIRVVKADGTGMTELMLEKQ